MLFKVILTIIISIFLLACDAKSDDELKKFVSLKGKIVNIRNGPGEEYKVIRSYDKTKMPLSIIHRIDNWYMVKDYQDNIGWLRVNLVNSNAKYRTIIMKANHQITRFPSENSTSVGEIKKSEIAILEKCNLTFCRIKIPEKNLAGWIGRASLWGVGQNEVVK